MHIPHFNDRVDWVGKGGWEGNFTSNNLYTKNVRCELSITFENDLCFAGRVIGSCSYIKRQKCEHIAEKGLLTKVIIFVKIYDKSWFHDKSDKFKTKVIYYMTKVILVPKSLTKVIFSLKNTYNLKNG